MFAGRPLWLGEVAVALTAMLCLALGAPGAVPGARAAVVLPPDLMALEQQMGQLHVASERFSLQLELSIDLHGSAGSPGSGSEDQSVPLVLILVGAGEASESPSQVSLEGGLPGTPLEQTRLIGDTVYRDRPEVAHIDGGRPWVSSPRAHKEEPQGLDPSNMLEGAHGGAQGTFSGLIEQLNKAQSVVESGPVTVDDQRVTEFDAMLDPTSFLEKLRSRSKQPRRPLSSIFEGPETGSEKAPAKPSPPPTLKLELFLAPNGLPVRDRVTFTAEGATVAIRFDTTAINIPVHVSVPPAGQTISEARLKRLEAREARRQLKQALRACRHLRGRRAVLCRREARVNSPSRGSGSSGSLF